MKIQRTVYKASGLSGLTYDDLYEEISHDWQRKARALQTRRWREIKREMKGGV